MTSLMLMDQEGFIVDSDGRVPVIIRTNSEGAVVDIQPERSGDVVELVDTVTGESIIIEKPAVTEADVEFFVNACCDVESLQWVGGELVKEFPNQEDMIDVYVMCRFEILGGVA